MEDPCVAIYEAIKTIQQLLIDDKLNSYDSETPDAIQELRHVIEKYIQKERDELIEYKKHYLSSR